MLIQGHTSTDSASPWPSAADHIARADANATLAERLADDGEFAWASTIVFYSALHDVCALLAERNGIATDGLRHIDIEAKLDKHHPGITARYLALAGESRRCRHIPHHDADRVSYRRVRNGLKAVRDYYARARAGKVPGV